MKTVYLCGGINGLTDEQAKGWREVAADALCCKFEILDPMRRDYRGREDESVDEIVRGDLEDIDKSNVILANCARPSWGTAMEVYYAATWHNTRGPQLCVHPPKGVVVVVPPGPVSPWLRKHSTQLVRTLEDAISLILETFGR